MIFAVLPLFLIPLAKGAGCAIAGGVAAWLAMREWHPKPPFKDPGIAYKSYVSAVQDGDYKRYQQSVANPASEAEFKMRHDQRSKNEFAPIKEGTGEIRGNKTEAYGKALCPWERREEPLRFKKVGDSWTVIEHCNQ